MAKFERQYNEEPTNFQTKNHLFTPGTKSSECNKILTTQVCWAITKHLPHRILLKLELVNHLAEHNYNKDYNENDTFKLLFLITLDYYKQMGQTAV